MKAVSKAAMGRAVAAPLPPDSDVGWEDGSEAGAPHQPRLSSAPSARSSAGNHGRAGRLPNTRFESQCKRLKQPPMAIRRCLASLNHLCSKPGLKRENS
eukprot:1146872-Pelagomonas_calceolata.AAC.7